MSFGPFRISCVSRQISDITAVFCNERVRRRDGGRKGEGGLLFRPLNFSHFVLMAMLVKLCVKVPLCLFSRNLSRPEQTTLSGH